jgi:hypothetical protein
VGGDGRINLAVAGVTPAGISRVTGLIIDSGQLNLASGKIDITSGVVGTQNGGNYTDLTGLIQSGHNGGSGGRWTGQGIITAESQAATGNLTTLGIAAAAQVKSIAPTATAVWSGETVTGSDVLIMYTYGGDANLDGKINVDDYGHIDSSIGIGLTGWFNGDFNYDGKINVDDYGIIDFNIGIQGPPFSTAGSSSALPTTAVPEPVVVAVTTFAGALRRRRRMY